MRSIEVSCNAYLWMVGKQMWRVERTEHIEIAQNTVELGFGMPTGVQQQIASMGGTPDVETSGNTAMLLDMEIRLTPLSDGGRHSQSSTDRTVLRYCGKIRRENPDVTGSGGKAP